MAKLDIELYEFCSYSLAGFIQLLVYFPFFVYTCIQFYHTYDEKKRFNSHKVLYHLFLSLYFLFEIVYSIGCFLYNESLVDYYQIHEMASFCNNISFAVLVHFWAKSFPFRNSRHQQIFRLEVLLLTFNFVAYLTSSIVVGLYGFFCYTDVCVQSYTILHFADGFILFLLSLFMLIIGIRLMIRLQNHYMGDMKNFRLRFGYLIRINGVMLSCTLCYTLRAFCEALIIYNNETNKVPDFMGQIWTCEIYWVIFSRFSTYLIPSAILLYVLHPKKVMFPFIDSLRRKMFPTRLNTNSVQLMRMNQSFLNSNTNPLQDSSLAGSIDKPDTNKNKDGFPFDENDLQQLRQANKAAMEDDDERSSNFTLSFAESGGRLSEERTFSADGIGAGRTQSAFLDATFDKVIF